MADIEEQSSNQNSQGLKKPYRKPELESYGSIVEMTKTGPVATVDDNATGAIKSASGGV